ncbi:cupin domain-containing protein [Temperatibacter marinus]|uniref:Cupin domain-containing protein n=1 Tax=Temperatibacter marinus TaxID=1456591 RepID=A0AA52EFX6_9PROT|nr:cupin domain-containing protein [Temperatibacter marinus]WND02953.1 cupin domain-containing protein [Temperatibacter marinus]
MDIVQNLTASFSLIKELYAPHILTDVNDSRVMLVKLKGQEVPWHSHDTEDELFIVFSGQIYIHFRDKKVAVHQGELFKVPRGVEHRVTSPNLSLVLLIEAKNFKHTGATLAPITKHDFPNVEDLLL